MTPADRPLPAHAQTIADLRAARALIAKGWTRHLYERDGRFCLSGAVRAVTGCHDGSWSPRRRLASDALELTVGMVLDWNDAQPSKRPVLLAIDQTIARLEASA